MNVRKAHRLLAQNLVGTYIELANGVPGTEIIRGRNWVAAINQFSHPICNFAVCDNVEQMEAADICRLAFGRRHFNVYVCRTPEERLQDERLLASNFSPVFRMAEMAFEGPPVGRSGNLAKTDEARRRKLLCDFMTWQFFATQSPAVREKISLATANASGLETYELLSDSGRSGAASKVEQRNRPIGAVMLSRGKGIVGLYNLCVDNSQRSKGYGASIVFAVQAHARHESVIVGLQCDPKLTEWYRKLGFKEVGSVCIYGHEFSVKL